jgi:hypothetical protein
MNAGIRVDYWPSANIENKLYRYRLGFDMSRSMRVRRGYSEVICYKFGLLDT